MTIMQWCQKYNHKIERHQSGASYITADMNCEGSEELYHLSDCRVSAYQLGAYWLVPTTVKQILVAKDKPNEMESV